MGKLKWICALLLAAFAIQAHAGEEKNLKDIYTAITNKVNSAMLTHRGADEIFGSAAYQEFKEKYGYPGWYYEYPLPARSIQQRLDVDLGYSHFFFNNLSLGLLLSLKYKRYSEVLERWSPNAAEEWYRHSSDETWLGPIVKKIFGHDRIRPFVFVQYLFAWDDELNHREVDFGMGLLVHVSGNLGITMKAQYGILSSNGHVIPENYYSRFMGSGYTVENQTRLVFSIGLSHFIL